MSDEQRYCDANVGDEHFLSHLNITFFLIISCPGYKARIRLPVEDDYELKIKIQSK